MNYLPSKKFIIIAVSIFVFLGIIFFLVNLIGGRKEVFQQRAGLKIEKVTFGDVIENDSDGDGLKDWEEVLWETNPNNPDTDGDGVSDNEEIKLRREELQISAGQNKDELLSSDTSEEGNLNETELFAREFFTTVVALQQSGNLNEENLEKVFDSLPSFTENFSQQKIYTLSDLDTTGNESVQVFNNYLKDIEDIFTAHSFKNENTIFILNDSLESGNKDILEELSPIIENGKAIVMKLLEVEILPSASLVHLNLLNSFQGTVESIEAMKMIYENPLIAFSAITQYINNLGKLQKSGQEFNTYLLAKEKEFSQ